MTLSKKVKNFLTFSLDYKLPKMLKRKSDEELLKLYDEYSSHFYIGTENFRTYIISAFTIYSVGEELKRRYPHSMLIQNWDYRKQLNLHAIMDAQKKRR